jgi:bla regulator protein BlaR1
MNKIFQKNKNIIAAITAGLVIGGITMSFQNTPFGPIDKLDTLMDSQDTLPAEKNKEDDSRMSMKDFDLLIQNMDKEMIKMQKEVTKTNFDKMHQEIAASLDKVDFDKIKREIDKAMKDIDFSKIEKGVKSALNEIDWENVDDAVKGSLQDAKKEIEKINMESVKREMEKAKLEIEISRNELKKINIDEIAKNANAGIAKAKEELRLKKQMFNEMEKDGLISKKEGFTIEYKDKTLIINGKIQNDAVRDKYQQYIKGDPFKISISGE